MVGEIGEGIEGECITGIPNLIVFGDEDAVVLEHFEPVEFLLFGGVGFAMLLAPAFEELRGVGRRGRGERCG